MTAEAATPGTGLAQRLQARVGRHDQKMWDWDAFPASRGYPELARAQMRYIGAGGSPKVGDTSTLPPEHFTCSLIYQEASRYAAPHVHEIEEIFFVQEGRLTVSWDFDGTFVDLVLGPGDALCNPPDVSHGFRNDGPQPVVAQFMVGHPRPLMPAYRSHPSNGDAGPEFGRALLDPEDPRVREMRRWTVRAADVRTDWHDLPGGGWLAHQPYVMPASLGGVVAPGHFGLEMLALSERAEGPWLAAPYEVALMVWEGVLRVEWEDGSDRAGTRLRQRDLVQIPGGQRFRVSNDGAGLVRAAVMVGSAEPPVDLWSTGG